MKICFRSLRENDTDLELIFGVLILPILFFAAWYMVRHAERFPVQCLFHRWTGFPCPTCGTFRALQQIKVGHIGAAWRLNPLGTVAAFAGAVFVAYSWIAVLFRLPRPRLTGVSRIGRILLVTGVVVVILTNWWWLVASRI